MSDIGTYGLDLFEHARQAGRSAVAPAPQNPCTTPAEPPPEVALVRNALSHCIGRDRAKTAPQIAEAAGIRDDLRLADRGTAVRKIIRTWYESLALEGYVLIAASSGFWYTNDAEELAHYDATQRSRIREIALTLKRTRLQARTSAGLTHHGRGRWST